jgi:FMN-dependent NADH-azoreductase
VLDEFLAADTIVIGAPMYNFTLSTQLKSWIDRLMVAGRTFRYTENGPEGLAGGRRVIIAIARGGVYSAGAPAAALEHLETYLRGVFNFMGIEPEFVIAEGLNLSPEQREAAIGQAIGETLKLAA